MLIEIKGKILVGSQPLYNQLKLIDGYSDLAISQIKKNLKSSEYETILLNEYKCLLVDDEINIDTLNIDQITINFDFIESDIQKQFIKDFLKSLNGDLSSVNLTIDKKENYLNNNSDILRIIIIEYIKKKSIKVLRLIRNFSSINLKAIDINLLDKLLNDITTCIREFTSIINDLTFQNLVEFIKLYETS